LYGKVSEFELARELTAARMGTTQSVVARQRS